MSVYTGQEYAKMLINKASKASWTISGQLFPKMGTSFFMELIVEAALPIILSVFAFHVIVSSRSTPRKVTFLTCGIFSPSNVRVNFCFLIFGFLEKMIALLLEGSGIVRQALHQPSKPLRKN